MDIDEYTYQRNRNRDEVNSREIYIDRCREVGDSRDIIN